ncbi:hypothetical protein BN863_11700 [Formosa agariphila KMM 3901]|uniref:EF-hand domain-containing protein n=2 Tax=Formosa TaxID=225842 RepID=T2KJ31_FORAG|nr:hypothetical protein BN863_11700 [Formosa agariphila KMM 3901]
MACEQKKEKKQDEIMTTKTSAFSRKPQGGEGRKPEGGGPPSFEKLLAEMDSNGDGKLSKSEVKGPLETDFYKLDTDKDGFISKTELEHAPKPERGQRPPKSK